VVNEKLFLLPWWKEMELALVANPLIKLGHRPFGRLHVVFLLLVGSGGEGEDVVGLGRLDLTNGAGRSQSPRQLRFQQRIPTVGEWSPLT
jgi:hypothetical protein